jgi:5-methyltetrahydrofolate--homocysteine methyltransferase
VKLQSRLLDVLEDRVLIWDGAMGTQIHAAGLTSADYHLDGLDAPTDGCHELLNLTRPDVIEQIHTRYFEAGADMVETNTFGCTSIVLSEFGIPQMDYELGLAAARVARKAADRFEGKFVVGAIGPGTKLVSLGQTTFDEIEHTYSNTFRGTLEGGADALLIETAQDLLMVKAAIVGALRAMAETERQVPLFVQVTMEQTGTMLLGSELAAALNMVECFPIVKSFGLNCATGPVEMAPHIRFLGQNSTRPITVQPNAGLPVMERGQGVYKLTPEELAHHHVRFHQEFGLAMAGGCCGTTPDHIRAVADALKGAKHVAQAHWIACRGAYPGFDFVSRPHEGASPIKLQGCASLYQFQPYRQDTSFLIVGEKTNANGSKAFREMLSAENWEGLTELARELEAEGSHVLDVCTAYVGRDESRDMHELLSRYNRHIQVPIMIDSTEAPVIETALKTLAGKPIVNSINFEDGGERTERVLGLCTKYGAAVVALTIDEEGMAKTAERKVAIAERLVAATRRHGLPDHDVFIDCLTFTLGSGDEEFRAAGMETVEAIRELHRRYPSVNSILGVSNISFGLKPAARLVLNSAFLHYALEAGLTSAIVHFSKILPENKVDADVWKIAGDLVFDRREFAPV